MNKIHLISLITGLIIFLNSCSSKPTREELIEKDREQLSEILTTEKLIIYKSLKLIVRSNGGTNISYENLGDESEENLSMVLEQLQIFIEMVDDLNNISKLESVEDIRDLDPTKIYNIYKGLKSLKKNFHGIDEDMFPTLTEIFLYQNQLSKTSQNKIKSKYIQPYEHFILSQIAFGLPQLGGIISLYEIDKINSNHVESEEIRMYFNLMKAIVFMNNKLFYLSEKALTDNLKLLENKKEIDFHITNIFAPKIQTDKEARLFLKSVHYFFRGLDRKLMKHKEDRKLGNKDFITFIDIIRKLNAKNHYIQIMELYVLSDMEEKKKAKEIAKQMKTNPIFEEKEKVIIDNTVQSIGESDFFGIKSKLKLIDFLMLFIKCANHDLEKVDWDEFKKEYEIEFEFAIINEANEILVKLEKFIKIQELVDPKNYSIDTNIDSLNLKEKIMDNSTSLFNKASKLIEETIEDN